jgi:hypothetical protein
MIMTQSQTETIKSSGRKGDGGTYLVLADDSAEFQKALSYACRAVRQNRGHLGILHVVEGGEFQHWGAVEARIQTELRAQGEQFLWRIAGQALEQGAGFPALYLGEGDRTDCLISTINGDLLIVELILGAGVGRANPLISYFTGRGLSRLRVPVVVVPDHLA